jgi:methyl-accepting chemotaxis protein
MREQAAAGDQITQAVDSMRRQADQTTKAMAEQVRAARDMTVSSQNVSKQIGLMTRANREHASQAQNVISALAEIRTVTESNARGVRETQRAAASLLERAKGLNTIMDRLA